jgi:protocatechuate 3,4-dioxygenase alpha subunit
MDHVPTPSATVGPFLHIGLTEKHSVTQLAAAESKGERVFLRCRVFDAENVPVNDAIIELWQTDNDGRYNHPDDPRGAATSPLVFMGFGRAATNERGFCEFETIKPGRVPAPDGKLQAPHINVAIYARGILLQLYTRIYFAGDPANEQDPVLALVPESRRKTLLACPDVSRPNGWQFDIRLRGENETVFFDV